MKLCCVSRAGSSGHACMHVCAFMVTGLSVLVDGEGEDPQADTRTLSTQHTHAHSTTIITQVYKHAPQKRWPL
jgi:hypothetical protein